MPSASRASLPAGSDPEPCPGRSRIARVTIGSSHPMAAGPSCFGREGEASPAAGRRVRRSSLERRRGGSPSRPAGEIDRRLQLEPAPLAAVDAFGQLPRSQSPGRSSTRERSGRRAALRAEPSPSSGQSTRAWFPPGPGWHARGTAQSSAVYSPPRSLAYAMPRSSAAVGKPVRSQQDTHTLLGARRPAGVGLGASGFTACRRLIGDAAMA